LDNASFALVALLFDALGATLIVLGCFAAMARWDEVQRSRERSPTVLRQSNAIERLFEALSLDSFAQRLVTLGVAILLASSLIEGVALL